MQSSSVDSAAWPGNNANVSVLHQRGECHPSARGYVQLPDDKTAVPRCGVSFRVSQVLQGFQHGHRSEEDPLEIR